MNLLNDVEAYIDRHTLLKPGMTVVVGVSGGPDSITLLHLLQRLAPAWHLNLHVAHLHHGIRGQDANADKEFVEDLAQNWHLPYSSRIVDVPSLAEREKLTLEEAARRARYGFLCEVAEHIGAHRIAVAHNADDQAETVLMHLLRGTGPAGLRGMLPATRLRDYRLLLTEARPAPTLLLIRPLLNVTREEIEAYCRQHELAFRFDQSNLDTTYFRNRLRHEVLPYLAQFNPRISERLRNLAEVVRADYRLLEEFVGVARDTLLVATHSDALVFDLARWREQPLAIQRAIVRQAAYKLRRSLRDVDFNHVEHAVDIAQRGHTGAQAVLPHGLVVTVGYSTLTIADASALHLPTEHPWLPEDSEIPIVVPGTTSLPDGWTLQAKDVGHWNIEAIAQNPNPLVAWVDGDALGERPVLRTRREGDRFQPQGMQGAEVRLSDFLINAKIPRRWRDHLLLLEGRGQILWIVGVRLSHAARVHHETQRVVYLRFQGPQLTN